MHRIRSSLFRMMPCVASPLSAPGASSSLAPSAVAADRAAAPTGTSLNSAGYSAESVGQVPVAVTALLVQTLRERGLGSVTGLHYNRSNLTARTASEDRQSARSFIRGLNATFDVSPLRHGRSRRSHRDQAYRSKRGTSQHRYIRECARGRARSCWLAQLAPQAARFTIDHALVPVRDTTA